MDQKITPFLWFDQKAEEAAKFYVSIFPDSKISLVTKYDKESAKVSGQKEGSVMVVSFELCGMSFTALNGGPVFKPSGAISFVVNCKDQKEVDYYWDKLSDGGEEGQCGWINRDKFGITWQVVPDALERLLSDPDPDRSSKAMSAMLKMKKIIISDLEKAAAA